VLRTSVFGGAASALRVPIFRRYFLGHFMASIGRWMYRMSIGWLAYDLTESTVWLGAVAFADLVPSALLTIFAGAITDRFGYMRIIRHSLVAVILLSTLLGGLVITRTITVEWLLLIALLAGSAESLGQPARLAIVNALVPKHDLSAAIALGSTSFNASRIVGPSIAGLLIQVTGPGVVMLLCALAVFYFWLVVRRINLEEKSKPAAKGDSLWRDTLAGFTYVLNHRGIRFVMILLTATSLLVRPVIELLPSIARRIFESEATGLSMMLSGIGVGAVTASLVLARRGQTQGLTKVLVWSTFGTGLSVWAALHMPSIQLAALAFCFMGVFMLCGNVAAQTLVQNSVSSAMRARVLGLFIVFGHGLPALGALVQGWLATFFGLPAAVGGSAILMLAFWIWAMFRQRAMVGQLEMGSDA